MGSQVNASNPLKVDPSKTATFKRIALSNITRILKKLVVDIHDYLDSKSDLGRMGFTYLNLSDNNKVTQFSTWLDEYLTHHVSTNLAWLKSLLDKVYQQGITRSYKDVRGTKDANSLAVGLHEFSLRIGNEERLLLTLRTEIEIVSLTSTLSQLIKRVYLDNLDSSTNAITKSIKELILSTYFSKYSTTLRTEIVRVHAAGQLTSYELLGIKKVQFIAEQKTTGICSVCNPNDGKVFTIKEAKGLIPLHPNCSCAWTKYTDKSKSSTLNK